MADYSSLKVTELKKLLQERNLAATGNKADLVKRLQESDAETKADDGKTTAAPASKPVEAEDEIDYEDDDVTPAAAAPTAKKTAPAATASAAAPTTAQSKPAAPAATDSSATAETKTSDEPAPAAEVGVAAPTEEAAAPVEPPFTLHLASTNPDDEAAKRAARALRFQIPEESLEAKKAARAARFGLDKNELAKSLDSALPDRPAKKRGRADGEEDGSPAVKKVAPGGGEKTNGRVREGGNRGKNVRGARAGRGGNDRGGRGGQGRNGGPKGRQDAGAGPKKEKAAPPAMDPAEKAKLQARAERFKQAKA